VYSEPLAYFLTWTCYGTRLHGDARGTVDRWHNTYGESGLKTNHRLRESIDQRLAHPPYHLDAYERTIVEDVIRAHVSHRRWRLHALNVRTTHVHIVVSAGKYTPELAMEQLKGWGTRRLRDAGLLGATAPAWTDHGSTQYVWNEDQLFEAVNYVQNCQGDDLPKA
jgi:REP element-mobilizing transposase RayT